MTVTDFKSIHQLDSKLSVSSNDLFIVSHNERGTISSYGVSYQNVEHQISSNINSILIQPIEQKIFNEYNLLSNQISALSANVDSIWELIPDQASKDNQLADKEFVNSSIATNTAHFKGTYDTLEELKATCPPAQDLINDYAFVRGVDSEGNALFNRYKCTKTETTEETKYEWLFEYTLNNSSFTENQWKTINSGITSALVEKIKDINWEEWTFFMKDESIEPIVKKVAVQKPS